MEFWFSEFHTPDVKHSIRVNKQLYSKQSDYQRIDIFETPEFGRVLTLDGNVMLTERDEFIYDEMIVHVPMAVHKEAKDILVIGAGDGGVVLQQPAREIELHYASVRVGEGSLEVAGDTCFDVVVDGVDGAFTATVDGELKLALVPAGDELPSRFEMRFTDEGRASAGCGRTMRWEPIDEVRNVRIVGDVSSVEVFVNDGALVFSTRIYPEAYGVTVDAPGASVNYHTLII